MENLKYNVGDKVKIRENFSSHLRGYGKKYRGQTVEIKKIARENGIHYHHYGIEPLFGEEAGTLQFWWIRQESIEYLVPNRIKII